VSKLKKVLEQLAVDLGQVKTTEICIKLTFHSPSPTPLLPAPTLSAGEHKVSGGESKVS
jgi:hypothetical protein